MEHCSLIRSSQRVYSYFGKKKKEKKCIPVKYEDLWQFNLILDRFRYEESEAYQKKGDRDPRTLKFIARQLINANGLNHSTKLTSQIVTYLVVCYGIYIYHLDQLFITVIFANNLYCSQLSYVFASVLQFQFLPMK